MSNKFKVSKSNNENNVSVKSTMRKHAYKFISYPLVAFVVYIWMNFVIFTIVPYTNSIAIASMKEFAEFAIYYPSYLVIDAIYVIFAWWLSKKFAKFFISGIKKLVPPEPKDSNDSNENNK